MQCYSFLELKIQTKTGVQQRWMACSMCISCKPMGNQSNYQSFTIFYHPRLITPSNPFSKLLVLLRYHFSVKICILFYWIYTNINYENILHGLTGYIKCSACLFIGKRPANQNRSLSLVKEGSLPCEHGKRGSVALKVIPGNVSLSGPAHWHY